MAHSRVWRRTAAGTTAGLVLALAAGCAGSSDGSDSPDSSDSSEGQVADAPASTPAATPSETTDSAPTATPTATPTPTPAPSETASEPPTAAPSSSGSPSATATATPTPSPATTGAQRGLRSARADVKRVAPQLQTYFDEREYPADRAQLLTALGDAGVTFAAGNSIGGYGLAGSGVDFVLCVQHDGGGWATFDTAAGGVDETGATGACPAD
jgi:hypothetical protein